MDIDVEPRETRLEDCGRSRASSCANRCRSWLPAGATGLRMVGNVVVVVVVGGVGCMDFQTTPLSKVGGRRSSQELLSNATADFSCTSVD